MLIHGQKSYFLGPTIFKIPQPNWYYSAHTWFRSCITFRVSFSSTSLPSKISNLDFNRLISQSFDCLFAKSIKRGVSDSLFLLEMGLCGSQASTKKSAILFFKENPTFGGDFCMFSWQKKSKLDFCTSTLQRDSFLNTSCLSVIAFWRVFWALPIFFNCLRLFIRNFFSWTSIWSRRRLRFFKRTVQSSVLSKFTRFKRDWK